MCLLHLITASAFLFKLTFFFDSSVLFIAQKRIRIFKYKTRKFYQMMNFEYLVWFNKKKIIQPYKCRASIYLVPLFLSFSKAFMLFKKMPKRRIVLWEIATHTHTQTKRRTHYLQHTQRDLTKSLTRTKKNWW